MHNFEKSQNNVILQSRVFIVVSESLRCLQFISHSLKVLKEGDALLL